VLSRKKLIVFALIAVISITSGVYAYSNFMTNQDSKLDGSNNDLFIESFSPSTIGSNVTGGTFVLVNPTNKNFENLTLTIKIDDSPLIAPNLRLQMHLPIDTPFDNYNVPITQISIEPNQNKTIQLYLYDPSQNETSQLYQTNVSVQTFSSHILRFYITQETFGDVVNGQSLTIPQEKAYLQITGYSLIEHDNDTWHQYFNSSKNRYEYVNDQPNFYQQYHHSEFYPMESSSYNWAKTLNQLGEHYFNVTVFNNSTFPVQKIAFNLGEGGVAFASDKIVQPNETYIFPVAAGGQNWWSVGSVNQLSNFYPAQAYASGDLTNRIE
jgi:hypothetical protein